MLDMACALLAAAVLLLGGVLFQRSRLPVLRRRVWMPLRVPADHAVRGVILRVSGPWLTVADGALVRPDRSSVQLPGEVLLHRDNVVFFQAEASSEQ